MNDYQEFPANAKELLDYLLNGDQACQIMELQVMFYGKVVENEEWT